MPETNTNINEILTQQQEIEARLLELKQIAWNGGDGLDKTNVETAIVPSIYTYVKNEQGEGVQTVPTSIILNINGNQYIINNQDDDNVEEDNKKYNFDLTVSGQFRENLDKAEHFVQDTITDADVSEISETDEENTDETNIDTTNVKDYDIDELKSKQADLNEDYIQLEAQRWIAFVKNLIAYINDFEPIIVKTVHDGEYQIDATTDFGLIATSDENNTSGYEATSVNTIFITTETVTAPVEEDSTEGEESLAPPTKPGDAEEDTDNVPDDTEIGE